MDISILLFLQTFREATGTFLTDFFSFITTIAVEYYVLVPMLILFWTVDKKKAGKILLTWGTARGIGAFLKATFCVYRPWIRDSRIQPPADIMKGATGYSFPSGHSFSAGGFWNGLAISYRKYRGIIIFSVCIVLLTMFSRIYFGVHTPQDVLVGGLVSLVCAVGISRLYDYIEQNPDRDWMVLAAVTVLTVLLLFYIGNKEYPMDYVDGQLLVDPKKMTVDGFKDPGRMYGIVLGWFVERRFVKFKVDGTTYQKVMRALVGVVLTVFWWTVIAGPVGKAAGVGLVHFVMQATTPFVFMVIYPMIFTRMEKHVKNKDV